MKLSTFSNQNRLQKQMYLEKVRFVLIPTRHDKEGPICFEVDANYQSVLAFSLFSKGVLSTPLALM